MGAAVDVSVRPVKQSLLLIAMKEGRGYGCVGVLACGRVGDDNSISMSGSFVPRDPGVLLGVVLERDALVLGGLEFERGADKVDAGPEHDRPLGLHLAEGTAERLERLCLGPSGRVIPMLAIDKDTAFGGKRERHGVPGRAGSRDGHVALGVELERIEKRTQRGELRVKMLCFEGKGKRKEKTVYFEE